MSKVFIQQLFDAIIITNLTIGIAILFLVPIYWMVVERKNVKPNPNKPWKH